MDLNNYIINIQLEKNPKLILNKFLELFIYLKNNNKSLNEKQKEKLKKFIHNILNDLINFINNHNEDVNILTYKLTFNELIDEGLLNYEKYNAEDFIKKILFKKIDFLKKSLIEIKCNEILLKNGYETTNFFYNNITEINKLIDWLLSYVDRYTNELKNKLY